MKAQLQEHLDGLPPEVRPAEKERILLLSQTRDYLVSLMKYLPYGEGVVQVRLRDGSVLRGSIPYCTKGELTVRLDGPKGGSRKLTWGELAFEQHIAFFDYYMEMRANQGGNSVAGTLPGANQKEAAEDCIRIALLGDWYGIDSVAHAYAALAQEKDPGCAARLHRLVPEDHAGADRP